MLRKFGRIASRIIIAGAAILSVALAVSIGRAILESGVVGMRRILTGSLCAAVFIMFAVMMISYLVRKFRGQDQVDLRPKVKD